MNNLMILFLCCILMSLVGLIQNTACGGAMNSDGSYKNNACNNIMGFVACIVCCGSIILMLNK